MTDRDKVTFALGFAAGILMGASIVAIVVLGLTIAQVLAR
jgi:hypothetical protein